MRVTGLAIVMCGLLLGAGCSSGDATAPPIGVPPDPASGTGPVAPLPVAATVERVRIYREVTEEWGLDFRHDSGATGDKHMVESMGSGGCLFDADGDGDLDIYLVQSGRLPVTAGDDARNRLYLNEGGKLRDGSRESGADDPGYGQGAIAADVEGDGDMDIFVANWGPDVLLINDGSGHFTAKVDSGVAGPDDAWSTSSAFFDADLDGDLDLFVACYVTYDFENDPFCGISGSKLRAYCSPNVFAGAGDHLYENLGGAQFREVTQEAGITRTDGKSLGVAAFDADGDGDTDIFVADDRSPNLYYNNVSERGGPIRYLEDGAVGGLAFDLHGSSLSCMGISIGDVDGDDCDEVFVTNFSREVNTLYSRAGTPWYEDITTASGLGPASMNYVGWGTAMTDVDHDGDLDILVANGHVEPDIALIDASLTHKQPTHLYLGDGTGRFRIVDEPALASPWSSRGVYTGDLDRDGRLDLVLTSNNSTARVFLAIPADQPRQDWLVLELEQPGPNRGGVGARVTATLADGRRISRSVSRGDSILGASAPELHFGVGDSEVITLEIRWPDGELSRHEGIETGRRIVVQREPAIEDSGESRFVVRDRP